MSARISLQTQIMTDNLAQQILVENKGDCDLNILEMRVDENLKDTPIEKIMQRRHIVRMVVNDFSRRQTIIRQNCERQGDLFRPQMLIPTAPKVLTRFGTGGVLTVVGYQTETNRKLKGATEILKRIEAVTKHCTGLVRVLVANPTWDVTKAEIEAFGYKWRDDDDQPFRLNDDIIWDDGEVEEE